MPLQHLRRNRGRSILEFDPRHHLLQVMCPVLWVFGDPELDGFAPVEQGIAWVDRQAGNHSLIVIRNADHNPDSTEAGPLASLVAVRQLVIWGILRWLHDSRSGGPSA